MCTAVLVNRSADKRVVVPLIFERVYALEHHIVRQDCVGRVAEQRQIVVIDAEGNNLYDIALEQYREEARD